MIGQILLPPTSILLVLVLGALFYQSRWGKFLLTAGIMFFYVLSIEIAPLFLSNSLQRTYPAISEAEWSRADGIVLLSAGVNHQAPEYQGRDSLHGFGLARTAYAFYLYQKTGLPVLISGGLSPGYVHEPSAIVMGRKLVEWGVPEAMIDIEEKSRTTWENGLNSARLLQQKGIHNPLLVSSAWHMPRSVWSFEQAGVQVIPAPCDFVSYGGGWKNYFVPSAIHFFMSSQLLREYLGLIWYQIRYKQ